MAGREKHGVVRADSRHSLLGEIAEKLLQFRDADGTAVVTKVARTGKIYPAADPRIAPDLVIGYNDAYRASWDTVLGGVAPEILEDNLDRWSGEHLIDPDLVPGVLLANRRVMAPEAKLSDIAPTILAAFGIEKPSQMTGRNLFAPQ
jgi:predicted AlkP superfamily phosphohydrolase/phosphomutase